MMTFSEVLLVNSGGLEMSRLSSLMGKARQRVKRSKKCIILALLQRICDRDILDLLPTSQIVFLNFKSRIFPCFQQLSNG